MSKEPVYNFVSYKLDDVDEVFRIKDVLSENWIFRGHANGSWDMRSSLERELESRKINKFFTGEIEDLMLKGAKKSTQLQERYNLEDEDAFSWLSLLQHYGCKTRLVDFTESFDVALYFATSQLLEPDKERENPDYRYREAAVWAISTKRLDEQIKKYQEEHEVQYSDQEIKERLVNNAISYKDRYKDSDQFNVVCGKPKTTNDRIDAQNGLFVFPLDISIPFQENLSKALGLTGQKEPIPKLSTFRDIKQSQENRDIIKFCISEDILCDILKKLREKGISEKELFPELDGFARSLNYYALGLD